MLATLPLVAFNFHRIPLASVFVTVLSLPVQPIILLGSLVTALAGLAHQMLGQFFGWLAWVPLSYQLGLVSLAPGYALSMEWVSSHMTWGWYIVLAGILLLPSGPGYIKNLLGQLSVSVGHLATGGLWVQRRPTSLLLWLFAGVLLLALAGVFWWLQVFSNPDGKLHVYFFDVSQGDSILIVTPKGRQVLVDGGPEAESATRALAGQLPLWDRSLELVVLTHLDADHARGLLEVLEHYRVSAVLVGEEDRESSLYAQWRATLGRRKHQVIPVSEGYQVRLEEGVIFEVLNPPPRPFRGSSADRNNNGVVLRLVHGEVSFLLAADIHAQAENYLVGNAATLDSTVLKVPHHGSKTSTTPEFLRQVNPSKAVVSAGVENQFGHPSPEVIARLEQMLGAAGVYQTAQQGTIEFVSDGRLLWVKTRR
jgi:competence protein ComEC